MNNLRETIENTLINNLEVYKPFVGDPFTSEVNYESIERCSDYIAQEVEELAVDFVRFYLGLDKLNMPPEIFTEFINKRYSK